MCLSPRGRDVRHVGVELLGHQRRIISSIQTLRLQLLHEQEKGFHVWGLPLTPAGMDRSMDQTEDRPQEQQLTACVQVWAPSAGHHWADRRSRLLPLHLHKQTFFSPYTPVTENTWSCQTISAWLTLKTGPGHYLGECNALLQQQYVRGATDI